ncbi:hypothetical protein JHK82_027951 [Glycine max]|nr:hypothetical protein JHK86_028076 [Glycine max]KAG5127116.1 hypothetical protein JHK82_027951 [Glycine max]KAG5151731.1 hypothetical protein JHK84_028203 [Glycine max]
MLEVLGLTYNYKEIRMSHSPILFVHLFIAHSDLLRALEASIGSPFSSEPLSQNPNPLIIVISGPSSIGKDAFIVRLHDSRRGLHFIVTATTRPCRHAEVDEKGYIFVSKEVCSQDAGFVCT